MSYSNNCPICGHEKMNRLEITEFFEYKGQKLEVPNYVIWECDKCKEDVVDKQTMKESSKLIKDFYRKVDGLLTASEIRSIRKFKLCKNQDELSAILGGGAKSFARYENSEVIQSEAMDNLLRILDKYPHALEVIQNKNKPAEKVLSMTMVYRARQQGKMVVNDAK